nr:immunoglobulin light chain junction region [Macaca mulatta]MOV75667.1 immunoglobulin light chain junction region [Macaca mulatta]
CQETSDLKLTF